MENHNEEMERYLKQFKPRAIRPLPDSTTFALWTRRSAAAAVLVLAGGLSFWLMHRGTKVAPSLLIASEAQPSGAGTNENEPVNTLQLTKLALQDDRKFDAVLSTASRKVLPRLQGNQSTLRILAGE